MCNEENPQAGGDHQGVPMRTSVVLIHSLLNQGDHTRLAICREGLRGTLRTSHPLINRHPIGRERQLLSPMRTSEARTASSARCCTHRISRFYRQGEYAMLIEFLSAIGHRFRPRWVAYDTSRVSCVPIDFADDSRSRGNVSAASGSKNTAIHFRGTPDSSKREVIGESPQDRRKQ